MEKIITKSSKETQKFAGDFAKKILEKAEKNKKNAIIIGLYGNLGAGKTTFTQGFAKGIGIKQKIISPTFVILKIFKITNNKQSEGNLNLIHIDAYRLESPEEILSLNWKELINNPQNIILIEWADKITKFLPKNYIKIYFKVVNENKREIIIKN